MRGIKKDFPILQRHNRQKPMVYLDTAATAQKPQSVIDAVSRFYANDYANVHRGIYELSERATALFEGVRLQVKEFINANQAAEIVFVSGTTEAINLVAQSYGKTHFKAGDEVILSVMEHHSNIVPWFILSEQMGIHLRVIPMDDSGAIDLPAYQALFTERTKLVAITHASNVLGVINPVKEMTAIAHAHGVPILLDGAQAIAHMPVDVKEIDCDFYVFSAHKLYGPTGAGVLYAKESILASMPPYQGGGSMIETVAFSHVTYAKPPQRFEAGTPDIAGVIGLGAAIDYVNHIGMNAIFEHDQALLAYAEAGLRQIPSLRMIGTARPKLGVISFVYDGVHPHDIGTVLDHEGIAIRAGHHCAMPLMERLQVPATVRVSFGVYNERADIDAFLKALQLAEGIFA